MNYDVKGAMSSNIIGEWTTNVMRENLFYFFRKIFTFITGKRKELFGVVKRYVY